MKVKMPYLKTFSTLRGTKEVHNKRSFQILRCYYVNTPKGTSGVFANIAFVIESAKNKTFVQVITLGINSAFYADQLPIMAKQPTSNWQAALYVVLVLGKRWK